MNKLSPFSVKEANDNTGFLLWQVTACWQRAIAAILRPQGLTQVQFALLASLLWLSYKKVSVTQTMLARQTKLDIMMTSQVLRSLERKGFVERKPHPVDSRAKIITLTESGIIKTKLAVPAVEKADSVYFKVLSKQQAQFNALLSSLLPTGEN